MYRKQIADIARSLAGTRFLHQGRSRGGIDCVGLLAVILDELGQSYIDVEGYRVSPPASVIYETLCKNFDEIPLSEVGLGDIYLMRLGGVKPKHCSVVIETDTDIVKGIEPQLIHAHALGRTGRVIIEPVRQWLSMCKTGFRFR